MAREDKENVHHALMQVYVLEKLNIRKTENNKPNEKQKSKNEKKWKGKQMDREGNDINKGQGYIEVTAPFCNRKIIKMR